MKKSNMELVLKTFIWFNLFLLPNTLVSQIPSKTDYCNQTRPELEKFLNLDGEELGYLDTCIQRYTALWELKLRNNKLTGLPPELFKLTKLNYLDISDNLMTNIPNEITNLQELKILILDGNPIAHLPLLVKNLTRLPKLMTLGLSNLGIDKFDKDLFKLKSLEELGIGNNKFRVLQKGFSKLENLKILAMNDNHIESIGNSLRKNKSLYYLSLSHCNFLNTDKIITQLSRLKQIRSLSICYDLTSNFNWNLFLSKIIKMKGLETLYLRGNNLGSYKDLDFSKLQHIKYLNLWENNIIDLPQSIEGLHNVEKIDLSFNDGLNLKTAFETLSKLLKLKELRISNCSITRIPDEIKLMTNLKILFVGGNPTDIGKIRQLLPEVKIKLK